MRLFACRRFRKLATLSLDGRLPAKRRDEFTRHLFR